MDKKKYIEVNHESITCGYTRLDIIGDMLDPDQITKLLSIVPRITWKRGKTLSSKGHEIEFIDSGWELIAENTDLTYHQQIEYWYNLLKYKTKTLKQFRKNGYKIKLNLYCFVDNYCNIYISSELFKKLKSLGVDLTIDCFLS